jgi:hypothetical protein
MVAHDDDYPDVEKGPADRRPGRTPLTDTNDRGDEQGPPDRPRSAAEAAEREQERQVADGTESPG